MLGVLLRQQLLALLSSLRIGRQRNGIATRRSLPVLILLLCLLIYCAGYFVFLFFTVFSMLFESFLAADMPWLGFSVMGILIFLIDFVMTIFTAKSQLFETRDNEFLLSLPIRPRDILLSRMLIILLTDYLFELLVAVPAYVAWLPVGGFSIGGLVCYLLCLAAMPLLALSLSCLVGWILSIVTSRMKNATVVNTILSLAIVILYLALCLGLQNYTRLLITNAEAVGNVVRRFLYPFYCLGDACTTGNFLSALLFMATMVIPFVITCVILARSFLALLTRKVGNRRGAYKEGQTRVKPLMAALIGREIKHVLSSTTYLINAGVGVVMMPVVGIGSFFLRGTLTDFTPVVGLPTEALFPFAAIMAISMVGGMIFFTAPSVSLEGVGIEDIKALPLAGHDFLLAKVYMQLIFVLPVSVLASILCVIALPCSFVTGMLVILVPPVFHTCFALIGLWMNILFPRFDWDSEVVVVKQSLAVTVTMLVNMFGGLLMLSLGAILLILLPGIPVWVSILVMAPAPLAISIALFFGIRLRGDAILKKL